MPEPKRSAASAAEAWYVPHPPNPFFTGRAKILNDLRETLAQHRAVLLTQARALPSLGGIGKTQTALAYALRFRKDYQAVFWARAQSDVTLGLDMTAIARVLGLAGTVDPRWDEATASVKAWLEDHTDWLLILDDVAAVEPLTSCLPERPKGQVLLAGRLRAGSRLELGPVVELPVMPAEEAAHFLFKRTARRGVDRMEREAAAGLAQALLYVPLALELAGAYLAANGTPFRDFLKLLREERDRPACADAPQEGILKAVETIWAFNMRTAEAALPAATDALRFSAFVHHEGIPVALLAPSPESLLETLTRYGLIRRDLDPQTYSMPPLIQDLISQHLDEDARRLWAERAVRAVHGLIPEPARDPAASGVLPHLRAASDLVTDWNFEFLEAAQVVRGCGLALARNGAPAAEALLKTALTLYEKQFGSNHPALAACLHDLGGAALDRRAHAEAKVLFERALIIASQILPRDHPDVATYLHSLGRVHHGQGRHVEAERLYRQALSIREKSLSPEDPDLAASLNSVAAVCHEQRRDTEAESLLRRCLLIVKRALPPGHPELAVCLHNLGAVLHSLKRYAEAEPLYRDALGIREEVLSPAHPAVVASLEHYAQVVRKLRRRREAAIHESRARAIRARWHEHA
jgi:tetratricopeptide (TPR) repeat protein